MAHPVCVFIFFFVFVGFPLFFHHVFDGVLRLYHPLPGFNIVDIPSQKGKVMIITGGTTGVGRASAEQLCAKGAKLIVISSRSQTSADKAAKEIQQKYCNMNGSKVIGKELMLEDHKSIKKFADWFRSLNEPLHVLMLNAGIIASTLEPTSLGLEKTIGVNWFGHFYLQHLLQDIIERSAPSRIVILTSGAAWFAPPLLSSIDKYTKIENIKAPSLNQYSLSKLFNIYHAMELHRKIREKGINNVYSLVVHPGAVKTNVYPSFFGKMDYSFTLSDAWEYVSKVNYEAGELLIAFTMLSDLIGLEPIDGARSQLYAATSLDIETLNISGEFIYPIARREDKRFWHLGILSRLDLQSKNEALAKQVWAYGESLIENILKEATA